MESAAVVTLLSVEAQSPVYSVVVPLHDEEAVLVDLYTRLVAVLDTLEGPWEIILVDDGSRDDTYRRASEIHERDASVSVVRLSRNFGHQVALSAGLDRARGDAVVTMDGDLQHPPESIPDLVASWRAGNQVVYGVMAKRHGETWAKRVTARLFYRLLGWLSDIDVPPAAGDFRLIDRRALDAFRTSASTIAISVGCSAGSAFSRPGYRI